MKFHFYLRLAAACLLCTCATMLPAQVKFNLQWLENEQAYQLSFIPEATWAAPQNITSSAQITIKAPTGTLDLFNVKCYVPEVIWEFNSRHDAPAESPGFDYLSFGMASMGTSNIPYVAGQEVVLITFQNANGCTGEVSLVDNASDPFMPPNSASANIGNQITVLGASGNAYAGNFGSGKANCTSSPLSTTSGYAENLRFEIFPTPVEADLHVSFDWRLPTQDVWLRLFDLDGKLVWSAEKAIRQGSNDLKLDVGKLKAGVYSIEMKAEEFTKPVGRFVKL